MAFFDFLTGNSDDKRDVKNRQKDLAKNQQDQSNQLLTTVLPWAQQAQQQTQGLFSPQGPTTAGDDTLAQAGQNLQQSFAAPNDALNSMHSGYQQMYDNPGYSQGEQRDIKLAATAPVAGAYGSTAGQLENRAARTGNSMGLIPAQAQFARAKARDLSQASLGATQGIADKRIEGQQWATEGFGREAGARTADNASRAGIAGQQATLGLGQGGLELDRVNSASDNARANIATSLLPAQVVSGLYGQTLGAGNDLQNQLYQQANKPGLMRGVLEKAIGSTADALTGKYIN